MGYTHYWSHNRPFTREEWINIGVGFSKLAKALPNVPLANLDGTGKPELTADYLIFNGVAPNFCEPFQLFRMRESWEEHRGYTTSRPWRGFCKTEHQPYDIVVIALLLMTTEIAPGVLNIESDEDMEGEAWTNARNLLVHLR